MHSKSWSPATEALLVSDTILLSPHAHTHTLVVPHCGHWEIGNFYLFPASGEDFIQVSETLNINTCAREECLDVEIVNDTINEEEETFSLSLTLVTTADQPLQGIRVGQRQNSTITITDGKPFNTCNRLPCATTNNSLYFQQHEWALLKQSMLWWIRMVK